MVRECQVPLTLTHHLRIVVDSSICGGAIYPCFRDGNLMAWPLERRVNRGGNHERIFRSQLEGFLVVRLCPFVLLAGGVKITQSKVWNVVLRIQVSQFEEILLRGDRVFHVAGEITE